jgi:hypothetical protein
VLHDQEQPAVVAGRGREADKIETRRATNTDAGLVRALSIQPIPVEGETSTRFVSRRDKKVTAEAIA